MDASYKQSTTDDLICPTTNIPYIQLEQGDVPCLFVHANGYPSACYMPLLQELKGYDVLAPLSRPCWDESNPYTTNQWAVLTDDLIAFAQAHYDKTQRPFHCIGHSMGAMVLLLALDKAPHLFDRIVFIEPIFVSKATILLLHLMPDAISRRLPLVKKTLNRPNQWNSLQQAFDFHRTKKAFSALPNFALWQFIIGGTQTIGEQWHLRYNKQWEAWFYHHLPNPWSKLANINNPMLGLRGEHSEFLTQKCWSHWQLIQPQKHFIEFKDQRHLLPLEIPGDVAHAILEFFD